MFPITLELTGRTCLVVGGGTVALRKIMNLMECGADIKVVSPDTVEGINTLAEQGRVNLQRRPYIDDDIKGCFLVFAATDDETVNRRISELCRSTGVLVNVVDVPEMCSFYVPSLVRRGALTLAVSTEGNSPLLARRIREQLETSFGEEYAEYVEMLGEARVIVKNSISQEEERRKVFESVLELPLLALIQSGQQDIAKERIRECIFSLQG